MDEKKGIRKMGTQVPPEINDYEQAKNGEVIINDFEYYNEPEEVYEDIQKG